MKSLYLAAVLQIFGLTLPMSAVTVSLTGPAGTSAPVGENANWTASNAANDGAALQYRWVITQNGATAVYRDFGAAATIRYAPMQEGAYTVTVTARNAANLGETDTASETHTATSLLTHGTTPVVTATPNPLVAIYSASCAAGSMRVLFAPLGTPLASGTATPLQPCVAGRSLNFQIAGMRENTTYVMAYQVSSGFSFTNGPETQFRTGAIPASVGLPTLTVRGVSQGQPVVLNSFIGEKVLTAAYDTEGNPIWYNSPVAPGGVNQLMRPMSGGTMVMAQGDYLQEIDLMGNIVRETNITRMNELLSKPPFSIISAAIPNRVADFNHEAIRLPNGDTAVLSVIEQIADQGQGKTDVLGDLIIVLDKNYQPVWVWDGFQHLDVKRKATLNDTCSQGQGGCPALKFVPAGGLANDWLHCNSLAWTGDGNILLSIRHQDWVIKVNYANGAGNGSVIWRLGAQGDFALTSGHWFSHQHNATLTGTQVTLFDNANGDHALFNGSRGLVVSISEPARTAEIETEARMNQFSGAVGSAQRLLNNNLYYLAGVPSADSRAIEFSPGPGEAAPMVYFDMNNQAYRSFRMKDLYTP